MWIKNVLVYLSVFNTQRPAHYFIVSRSTPDSTLPATRQVGHKGKAASKSSEPAPAPWLFPNLRVRIIDQKFQGGVYYNQKVGAILIYLHNYAYEMHVCLFVLVSFIWY